MSAGIPMESIDGDLESARIEAIDQLNSGGRVSRKTLNAIEHRLIPMFDAMLANLAESKQAEGLELQTQQSDSLRQFLTLRRDSWVAMKEAIVTNQPARVADHLRKWEASLDLVPSIKGLSVRISAPQRATHSRAWWRYPVTPLVVAANLCIFALMLFDGVNPMLPDVGDATKWGANSGSQTLNGESWRLFTSMFVHFGIIHVGFNMWVLWSIGRYQERLIGSIPFGLVYLFAGLSGSICSLIWNPTVVSAGASGAVFGVVGSLIGILAINRHEKYAVALRPLRNQLFTFVLINLAIGFSFPFIDNAAHIGGLLAGFVCGLIVVPTLAEATFVKRAVRTSVVALLGSAFVGFAVLNPPTPGISFQEFNREFEELEQNTLAEWSYSQSLLAAHQMQLEDFGEIVEADWLPDWYQIRKTVERVRARDFPQQRPKAKYRENIDARIKSLEMMRDAGREGDHNKLRSAQDVWAAATFE